MVARDVPVERCVRADASGVAVETDLRSSRRRLERAHRPLVVIDRVEEVVHFIVAGLLLVIAGIVLYRAIEHLIENRGAFSIQVTQGINDLLFVVIVMELLRTVVAHLETDDFQLRPFLIIGIISAVRHILTVGARLTLAGDVSETDFSHSQIELGVSAAVVLALSLGLLLISRAVAERRSS
jgi:uncharacterized membrane protein (DUF373 family)